MTKTSNSRHSEPEEASWVEWATGMISAFLVIVMIAWVAWQAMTEEKLEPEFKVSVTAKQAVEGGYRVNFDVENTATKTAAAVVVRGEILDGSNPVEAGDVRFDYVPAQSKSSGAILFSQDPGARTVSIRAIGYTDP